MEQLTQLENESFTIFQTLGILWLYCDINKSITYFEKALELKPKDDKTNAILVILKKKTYRNFKLIPSESLSRNYS